MLARVLLIFALLFSATTADAVSLRMRARSVITAFNFGSRTVIGWGGAPVNLPAASALTGTGNADFVVNSLGAIAPAGTVGSGTATFTRSSYSLGAVTGITYSISLLTGDQSIYTNLAWTGTDQVAAMFFGPCNNGTTDCAAKPTLGSTLWLRDGAWNTANVLGYTGFKAVSQYTGAGRITARSERPDATTDANGNPRLMHGTKLGMIYWDPNVNEAAPVDFRDIWWYNDSPTPVSASLFQYNSGSGANFYNSRVEYGSDVISPTAQYGLVLICPCTVDGMHFVNIGTALLTSGGGVTTSNSIFEGIRVDGWQTSGSNILADHDFGFGWLGSPSDHPDNFQWTGGTASFDNLVARYGIAVQDLGGGLDSCVRFADQTGPGHLTNVSVHNYICYGGSSHGIGVGLGDAPNVSFNTVLTDPLVKADGSRLNQTILLDTGINGGVVDHNVTNLISTGTQSGVITGSGNIDKSTNNNYDAGNRTRAQLCVTYALAMPNLPCNQTDPRWSSRAGVLFMFTPSDTAVASGGFKQTDSTFSGALFPACLTQANGAWNDGSVYACDAAWLISHPAAS